MDILINPEDFELYTGTDFCSITETYSTDGELYWSLYTLNTNRLCLKKTEDLTCCTKIEFKYTNWDTILTDSNLSVRLRDPSTSTSVEIFNQMEGSGTIYSADIPTAYRKPGIYLIFSYYAPYEEITNATVKSIYKYRAYSTPTITNATADASQISLGTEVEFTLAYDAGCPSNPISILWNFGDGSTSTDQNPSKTYNVAGIYPTSVSVTNGFATSNATGPTITVTSAPTSDFYANPKSVVVGGRSALVSTSYGGYPDVYTYEWKVARHGDTPTTTPAEPSWVEQSSTSLYDEISYTLLQYMYGTSTRPQRLYYREDEDDESYLLYWDEKRMGDILFQETPSKGWYWNGLELVEIENFEYVREFDTQHFVDFCLQKYSRQYIGFDFGRVTTFNYIWRYGYDPSVPIVEGYRSYILGLYKQYAFGNWYGDGTSDSNTFRDYFDGLSFVDNEYITIYVSYIQPTSAQPFDIYLNTSNSTIHIYDGVSWNEVSDSSRYATLYALLSTNLTSNGHGKVYYTADEPEGSTGAIWIDSDDSNKTYFYTSDTWGWADGSSYDNESPSIDLYVDGKYDVVLKTTNTIGNDTETKESYITATRMFDPTSKQVRNNIIILSKQSAQLRRF